MKIKPPLNGEENNQCLMYCSKRHRHAVYKGNLKEGLFSLLESSLWLNMTLHLFLFHAKCLFTVDFLEQVQKNLLQYSTVCKAGG